MFFLGMASFVRPSKVQDQVHARISFAYASLLLLLVMVMVAVAVVVHVKVAAYLI